MAVLLIYMLHNFWGAGGYEKGREPMVRRLCLGRQRPHRGGVPLGRALVSEVQLG